MWGMERAVAVGKAQKLALEHVLQLTVARCHHPAADCDIAVEWTVMSSGEGQMKCHTCCHSVSAGERVAISRPSRLTAAGGSMEADLDTRCPICLDNWGDSAAYAMPCCHRFCLQCIQQWTSMKPQCPLCKRDVESIIHAVEADADYKELSLSPAAVPSVATWSPAGPRPALLWPTLPMRPVGGLSPATWALLFREHPALLRHPRSWLRRMLRRMLGPEEPRTNMVANSVTSALRVVGLQEEILIQRLHLNLQGHAGNFVRHFITFTVRRCGRDAHRLLGLIVLHAAGAEEPNSVSQPRDAPSEEPPVPGPATSSSRASPSRDETPRTAGEELHGRPSCPHSNPETATTEQPASPHEEPEEPVAGPSASSLPRRTRRAPKRKARDSQASPSPKKRPPRRQK
ncbi:UNVERIFIED_CONTAM: hypothetical protein H355_010356 [Colinus virginianus]|nr:hypothetical protein H355_010356 [Colinus virginianus]